jgi:predicted enzyme related to lactoylglutathione lyase
MSQAEQDLRMDYVEFPSTDITATKAFYEKAFGWVFKDYGSDYTSFRDGRLAGGFNTAREVAKGGPLVVLYAVDLEAAVTKVKECGGQITAVPFAFPGGRRFHFLDPSGNELAVWSEK